MTDLQQLARVAAVDAVRPGDHVTELDTPEGPYYRVSARQPGSLTLDVDGIDVTLRTRPTDALLVRL